MALAGSCKRNRTEAGSWPEDAENVQMSALFMTLWYRLPALFMTLWYRLPALFMTLWYRLPALFKTPLVQTV